MSVYKNPWKHYFMEIFLVLITLLEGEKEDRIYYFQFYKYLNRDKLGFQFLPH